MTSPVLFRTICESCRTCVLCLVSVAVDFLLLTSPFTAILLLKMYLIPEYLEEWSSRVYKA